MCTGTKDDRVQWGPAMASFNKLPSGRWRAMVRKQGHTLSNTFRLKVEAETWAAEQENRIGRGEKPSTKPITSREIGRSHRSAPRGPEGAVIQS